MMNRRLVFCRLWPNNINWVNANRVSLSDTSFTTVLAVKHCLSSFYSSLSFFSLTAFLSLLLPHVCTLVYYQQNAMQLMNLHYVFEIWCKILSTSTKTSHQRQYLSSSRSISLLNHMEKSHLGYTSLWSIYDDKFHIHIQVNKVWKYKYFLQYIRVVFQLL